MHVVGPSTLSCLNHILHSINQCDIRDLVSCKKWGHPGVGTMAYGAVRFAAVWQRPCWMRWRLACGSATPRPLWATSSSWMSFWMPCCAAGECPCMTHAHESCMGVTHTAVPMSSVSHERERELSCPGTSSPVGMLLLLLNAVITVYQKIVAASATVLITSCTDA